MSNLINDPSAYLHPNLSNWNWWCWNAVRLCTLQPLFTSGMLGIHL